MLEQRGSHLTDEQLLRATDGELSAKEQEFVRSHLETCETCRTRRSALGNAATGWERAWHARIDAAIPPSAEPRALLRAQLKQAAPSQRPAIWPFAIDWRPIAYVAAAAGLAAVLLSVAAPVLRHDRRRASAVVWLPDARLTPGASLRTDRQTVCAEPGDNNKAVPLAVQRKVFAEYRIIGADPEAYEVDYLITPALGGADDIRNMWPHSNSSTIWNSYVKDALESRLRDLVCDGGLDLADAQREIATNWVAAYRKYFHTDEPLPEHRKGRE